MRKAVIVLSILILALMCSCKEPSDQVEIVGLSVENHTGYTIYWAIGGTYKALADGESEFITHVIKDSPHTFNFYRVDGTYSVMYDGQPHTYPVIVEGPVSRTVNPPTDTTVSVSMSAGSMVISEI